MALSVTILGEPPSAPESAPTSSGPAGKTTADFYLVSKSPNGCDEGSRGSSRLKVTLPPTRGRHMNFVFVNDRSPTKKSYCALCGESIERGYLREVGTGLFYCKNDCYVDHCESAADALANVIGPSLVCLASSLPKARCEADRLLKGNFSFFGIAGWPPM